MRIIIAAILAVGLSLYAQSTVHTGIVTVFPEDGPPGIPGFLVPQPGAWVYLESGDPFEEWSGDAITLDGIPYQIAFVRSRQELYIAEGYPTVAYAAHYEVDARPASRR